MLHQDPEAPIDDRVDDLIQRMTVPEKCSQLRFDAPAIERLGIPEYNWWNEALHGVARNGRATVFPQPIGLAATWNPEQVEAVAEAVSDEARAKHHAAVRRGARRQYQGLTFWTPNVNMFRDPRWGRGMETWGEDPCLTGEMGAAFVRGLQGKDPKYLKTAACAKHYAVHSGPESVRHGFDAVPPEKDFYEYYLPAFRRLVDEGVESVMPAYNRTYGMPCAGSKFLLQEILRDQWGFRGHVVSDCWAIKDFHGDHKTTKTVEESVALALKSGTDLNCGGTYCQGLEDAYHAGLINEDDIDRALRRLMRARFKLGMFDPEEKVAYASIPTSVVCSEEHRQLAHDSACDSFVLLKNDRALPLKESVGSLLVVGPNASSLEPMLGNYYGLNDRVTTVLEGVCGRMPEGVELDYRIGVGLEGPNKNPKDWATFEASRRDVTIACMGINPLMEGEEGDAINADNEGDRDSIELPQVQVDFLKRIVKTRKEKGFDNKLVVLLFGGSPIAAPEVHEIADAVLWVGYPGEAGGEAIASVLWGDAVPGGRLPFSVPISTDVLPPYEDYALEGRTYRFMKEENILYPFGFGLGFSEVAFENLEIGEDQKTFTVTLQNTGEFTSKEVVQAYLQSGDQPVKLAAFKPCTLNAGERKTVELSLPDQEPGTYLLHVGAAAPIQRSQALGAPKSLSTTLLL